MFERFTEEARAVVREGGDIARELGCTSIEAEHLLLAIARRSDLPGLDEETLREALERETERSLAAVGVSAQAPAFSPFVKDPKFATSAKTALENGLRVAVARHDRHIDARHLALAILQPDRGTVPRALAIAGIDRETLTQTLRVS